MFCSADRLSLMGCLHDPANVKQTSSKCIQNTRANAGRLLDRVNTLSVSSIQSDTTSCLPPPPSNCGLLLPANLATLQLQRLPPRPSRHASAQNNTHQTTGHDTRQYDRVPYAIERYDIAGYDNVHVGAERRQIEVLSVGLRRCHGNAQQQQQQHSCDYQ